MSPATPSDLFQCTALRHLPTGCQRAYPIMCGILAVLGLQGDARENRLKVLRASRKQRSRGPDATSVYASPSGGNFIAFERLNIVDVTEAGRYCLMHAGWKSIRKLLSACGSMHAPRC